MNADIDKLKSDIATLPEQDYTNLRDWFLERDWSLWDKKIKDDSKSGKLDFLIAEAKYKSLRTLPPAE